MGFVYIAQKLAAEAAEDAETCSEFERVSALLAISAASSSKISSRWCAKC
jgi:hypothetical protein